MISRYSIEIKEGIKGGEKRSEWGGEDWVSIRPGETGYPLGGQTANLKN